MRISERLKTIGKFVPEDSVVADIGTDHGYLLRHLLEENLIKKGIACDLNRQPLSYAEKNLQIYINKGKAEIRLGNGLEPVKMEKNIECIVIAGMGGRLIIDIIDGQKEFLNEVKRIILAPNIGWEKVRAYVTQNGWNIVAEDLVLEDGRFYPIIVIEKGTSACLSEGELFFGPLLIKNKHYLLGEFMEFEEKKLNKKISRMRKSKDPEIEVEIQKIIEFWKKISRCVHNG